MGEGARGEDGGGEVFEEGERVRGVGVRDGGAEGDVGVVGGEEGGGGRDEG